MVTATYTAGDAITEAFRAAAITSKDETVEADDTAYARTVLNRMLKDWQKSESLDWLETYMTHALTAERAQTLSPVRPVRINHVNIAQNGIERQLTRMTRHEYDILPNKTASGEPTAFYYDRQREAAVLYIWPVPAVVTGKTLEITYEREFPDIAADSDILDVPGEVWDTVVLCLGDRLADDYQAPNPALKQRAERAYFQMLAGQNEGSVWFGEVQA